MVPQFNPVRDRRFEEAFFLQEWFGSGYIVLDDQIGGSNLAVLVPAAGDEASTSKEERTHPVPIARTSWSGDARVKSADDVLNAIHIALSSLHRGVGFLGLNTGRLR